MEKNRTGQRHGQLARGKGPTNAVVTEDIFSPRSRSMARLLTYHRKKKLAGFLFIVPALIFFAVFNVYPMMRAIQISFFHWDLITPMKWAGLQNYFDLLHDDNFIQAFKATWYYIILVYPAGWVLGFALAVLLNASFPGRGLLRTVFFVPTVFPVIGVSVAWYVMYQPGGLVDSIVGQPLYWMTRTQWAMPGIAIMEIWRNLGYWMILFLVGLQTIPSEYTDAAKIDGAGPWQMLWHITLPLMKPTFALVVVISLVWGMQVMVPMFVMTQGGPGAATRSLEMLIYQTGMRDQRMGAATAMSVVLFLFMMVLTILQLRLFRERED